MFRSLHLPILVLLFVSNASSAQKLQISLSGGYAFPVFNTPMQINGYPYADLSDKPAVLGSVQYSTHHGASHGAGLNAELGLTYILNRYFSIGGGLKYGLQPKRYTGTGARGHYTYPLKTTQFVKNPLFASLCLLVRNETLPGFSIGGGILLPLHTDIISENTSAGTGTDPLIFSSVTLKTSFAIGLSGKLVYSRKITNRLSLTAAFQVSALSLWAKSSTLDVLTINGNDYTASVQPGKIHIVYDRNYNPQQNTSSGTASVLPSYRIPFNNAQFSLGVAYDL